MRKLVALMLVFILLRASAVSGADENYGPRDFSESEKWTAVVAAYEPEIKAIDAAFANLEEAKIDKVLTIKGVKYQLATYRGEKVVIFTTGVSVVNAAMTVQMALDYFPIDKIVMMGIAGAVNPVFEPGDIAVPERWYYHDESAYVNPHPDKDGEYILPSHFEEAEIRHKKRALVDPNEPKYKNFGFQFPREVGVVKAGIDSPQKIPYFTVSPKLLGLAKQALSKVETIKMPSGKPIQIRIGGNGVTGSVFADNAKYRLWLQDVYNAEVTEMESAAVGQVSFVNEVDWIVIRSVSDLAGGQKGQNDENVFGAIASGTGTKFMIALLDEIVDSKVVSKRKSSL
jgi:adenosylhomocysteine nucleosidase